MRYRSIVTGALACSLSLTTCIHSLAYAQTAKSRKDIFNEGVQLLKDSQFRAALRLLTPAYDHAVRDGDRAYELAFLNSIGTAQLGLYRNREAVATLTKASALATELNRRDTAAAIAGNLSDLYARLGHLDLAYAEAARAVELLPTNAPTYYRVQLLLNKAELNFISGDRQVGIATAQSAVREARQGADPLTLADDLRRLGNMYLNAGLLPEADAALSEALQLKLQYNARDLTGPYRYMGKLRAAQGRHSEALGMLNSAISSFESGRGRVAGWRLYYDRGAVKRALGRVDDAFEDFEVAIALSRVWHSGMPSLDELLTQADVDLNELTSAYVEAGMERYRTAPSRSLSERLFTVCEERRAMSLRQNRGWVERLPGRYWDILAQTRSLEKAGGNGLPGEAEARRASLRAELAKLEAAAGLALPENKYENKDPQAALRIFRQYLHRREALISFFLGNRESYVWALTTDSFEVHRLAAPETVTRLAKAYRDALVDGNDVSAAAIELRRILFGQLSPRVNRSTAWLLSIQDALFDIPFAALHDGHRFLVEDHSLRLLPSAFMLGGNDVRTSGSNAFIAFADPVYNRADPRFAKAPAPGWARTWLERLMASEASAGVPASFEFPRLPSSALEARGCARVWHGPSKVLSGLQVTRERLNAELAQKPMVLHFALHAVPAGNSRESSVHLALGMAPDGKMDFLTPAEISRLRNPVPIVVMSGCSSGRGQALPGAGLTGLTRAWLLAGSRAVTASHWQTADDDGAMFVSFYRSFVSSSKNISSRACADALRAAQVEMMRSRSARAQPKYWAAFFVMGRD